jgi:hypothetical protein
LPFATRPLSEKLKGHDVALVIGAPVFRWYPYVPGPYLPAGLRLPHISDDPAETARAPVGDSLIGDAVLALVGLTALMADYKPKAAKRIVLEDRMDLLRDGPVNVEPRRDEHELWTPPHRDRRWHRGANPEAPRFVTRSSDHASLRRVADRHRSILEIRVVTLLDGGIESVHVDVNDLANPSLAHWSI